MGYVLIVSHIVHTLLRCLRGPVGKGAGNTIDGSGFNPILLQFFFVNSCKSYACIINMAIVVKFF